MRFDTSAFVESEVRANANVRSEATESANVGPEVTASASVGHEASKTKSNIMRSGRGGLKWRSQIGQISGAIENQRDVSGNKRQRDASIGRNEGRGKMHDRSRSSYMEDQQARRDHDRVLLSVPWIIGSDRHHESNTHTTIHYLLPTDNPVFALFELFEIPSQHRRRRAHDDMTPPRTSCVLGTPPNRGRPHTFTAFF